MVQIRPEQYEALAQADYERLLTRAADALQTESFAPTRQRLFPAGASDGQVRQLVRESAERGYMEGFRARGDLITYVLLGAALPELTRDNGLEGWITAILADPRITPPNRMRLVRELLPQPERQLAFPV